MALLTIPATFGLPFLIVRETAKAMADRDSALVWTLWLWAQRFVLFTGAPVVVATIVWANLKSGQEAAFGEVWIWGGLLVPILALATLRAAAIQGLGHSLLSQMPETVLRPALVVGLTLGYLTLSGAALTAGQALLLNVSGTGIAFIIGAALLVHVAPTRPPHTARRSDPTMRRDWLVSAMTLGLALGAQTLGGNMDVLLLGLIRTKAEVGLYKVALNGGSLVGFGLQSINIVLMSRVAELYHEGKTSELQTLVATATRLLATLTLMLYIVIALGGPRLIGLVFGQEYRDAYPTLLIVGLGQIAGVLFGTVMLVINMTGNERESLRGTLLFVLLNFTLNIALIPVAGRNGAASATAISLLAFYAYMWRAAKQKTGIDTFVFARRRNRETVSVRTVPHVISSAD